MKRVGLALLVLAACGGSSSREEAARLVVSEIMYHPVLETAGSDEHEWVEIENAGGSAVDLGGYRLGGGIRFAFKAGTRLEPGGHLVVARRRAQLREVYDLPSEQVVGDFAGSLSNDGDVVTIEKVEGSAARVIDRVRYDDAFPWPMGGDALGAGEGWLPAEALPVAAHQFRGRSIERRSAEAPGSDPGNWAASALDGATPGKANRARGALAATVTTLTLTTGDKTGPVLTPGEAIRVRVAVTPGSLAGAVVEYYLDDQGTTAPNKRRAPLTAESGGYTAELPALPANTVMRYRVLGDRGRGLEPLAPQAGDPSPDYPAVAAAPIAGKTPAYQLFIGKARWEKLWDNILDGRVPLNISGGNGAQCELNPRWDERVPAVLVMGDGVYDVRTRYQGSRVNRFFGPRPLDPAKWPFDKTVPVQPGEPLSWHFNLPRYARFEGQRRFKFSKLPDQSCQGFFASVGNALFEMAGVPAAEVQYARLYINGRYYHYMQRFEQVDETMLARFFGPDEPIGDLFKSDGARWDEGPYGFGDERLLEPFCGFSAAERYDATYERQTWEDERPGSDEVRMLLEELHAARAAGTAALREHFAKRWDLPRLLSYMAVKNWLGAWDDVWQNHYLYRRADGRWMAMPTDLDNHFGFAAPSASDASFFAGVENGRSNYRDLSNVLKDSVLRAYRDEFLARVQELAGNVLHPNNVLPLIDEALAAYVVDEAREAPAGLPTSAACGAGDPAVTANRMKAFVRARHERVLSGLFD